jgi:hypothetical protein
MGASLAIWNMEKFVIAIATGAWGTGVTCQIQSEPLLPFGGSPDFLNSVHPFLDSR